MTGSARSAKAGYIIQIQPCSGIQKELLSFIHKSGVIKLNDISSQVGIPIGETRSFLFGLMHKGLVKADLGCDDLTNNPTLWATP